MNIDIIKFLRDEDVDSCGRLLSDIFGFDQSKLESVHNYIQWMFPLNEPSQFVDDAPILTDDQINQIRGDDVVLSNIRYAALIMHKFYYNSNHWLTEDNHNYRRITRIIKCLKLLRLHDEAKYFMDFLNERYMKYKNVIGETTYTYWKQAANGR